MWQFSTWYFLIDVVLLNLLLTLDKFHFFYYCFYCWIWANNFVLERFTNQVNSKIQQILKYSILIGCKCDVGSTWYSDYVEIPYVHFKSSSSHRNWVDGTPASIYPMRSNFTRELMLFLPDELNIQEKKHRSFSYCQSYQNWNLHCLVILAYTRK